MKNGEFRPPTEYEQQMLSRFLILWRNGQRAAIWRLVRSLFAHGSDDSSSDQAEVHLAEIFPEYEGLLCILEINGYQTCADVLALKPEELLANRLIGPGVIARLQDRLRARFGA